jgi:eukaryotic-like serine/threonine-protein kinase
VGFEVGQRVGDYEIVSILGVGGMGRVYQVRNVISNRTEAMKVLLPDLTAEPELAARFLSEIRTLAGFDHPNIAQLYTAFQVDNQLVMMMEFVEGSTLEERAKQGPISQDDVVDYMQQVLGALSYAHGRGVVHRDIKPANVMVTPRGVVKLMDFGIAKSKIDDDLTRPGTTIGSLYYMSPEQVRGGTVDARSDIYSVGIMMYELLAGRRPFEADSTYNLLDKQLNVPAQPPIEVNPQLSQPLSDLILKPLAKDPDQRFQNAAAFSNALRHVTGRPASTSQVELPPFTPVVIPAAAQAGAGEPSVSVSAAVNGGPAMPTRPVAASQRGLWIAIGAVAVLLVLICTAVGLPHFLKTRAMAKSAGDSTTRSASNPAPSDDRAAPVDSAPSTPAPVAVPAAPSGDAASSPVTPPAVPDQPPVGPAGPVGLDSGSQSQPAMAGSPKPPRPEYQRAPLPPSTPQVGGATPASTPPAAPPPAAGPTEAEVQQVRQEKVALDARAGAVSASVENLKHQQEADGLGLRQDMAGAYARLNANLRAADTALDSGNIAAARGYMDKADKEITILERLFGR